MHSILKDGSSSVLLPIQHTGLREFCSTVIVLGLITAFCALVALHALPTGLSWIRNPVSQYGITKYRIFYRVQTIAFGVAGVAATVGLAHQRYTPISLIICTSIFALARLCISWFPMDHPQAERTTRGRRHGLLALAAFGAALYSGVRLPELLAVMSGPNWVEFLSGYIRLVFIIGLLGMAVTRRARLSGFGLWERIYYVGMFGWLVILASVTLQSL